MQNRHSRLWQECRRKAKHLLENGLIEQIGENRWQVGRYVVEKLPRGLTYCHCLNWLQTGICSHVVAVQLFLSQKEKAIDEQA